MEVQLFMSNGKKPFFPPKELKAVQKLHVAYYVYMFSAVVFDMLTLQGLIKKPG